MKGGAGRRPRLPPRHQGGPARPARPFGRASKVATGLRRCRAPIKGTLDGGPHRTREQIEGARRRAHSVNEVNPTTRAPLARHPAPIDRELRRRGGPRSLRDHRRSRHGDVGRLAARSATLRSTSRGRQWGWCRFRRVRLARHPGRSARSESRGAGPRRSATSKSAGTALGSPSSRASSLKRAISPRWVCLAYAIVAAYARPCEQPHTRAPTSTSARFSPLPSGAKSRFRGGAAVPTSLSLLVMHSNRGSPRVPESSVTVEKVDFAGRDPVDAETRRPYGRSPGLRAAAETNLLPRNGPPDSAPDFFSGVVDKQHVGGAASLLPKLLLCQEIDGVSAVSRVGVGRLGGGARCGGRGGA